MTDAERMQVFEEKKKEIMDDLLKDEKPYPIPDEVETRVVDSDWNRGKSWYDRTRVLNNMNCRNTVDQTLYQFDIMNNGGVSISQMKGSLGEEAPVIK